MKIEYQDSVKQVLSNLATSIKGLSPSQVKLRTEKYGKNILKHEHKVSPIKLFLHQFNDFLIWILIAATLISYVLHEKTDAYVIAIILILNATFGFIQEYKAEKAIDALKKLSSLHAIVIRNGKRETIDARDLVPGDIIVLEEGNQVPADSRLIESIELRTMEASLTGESTAVNKTTKAIKNEVGIGDQINMIFAGTNIVSGHGLAVVVKTAMKTEIGKIAKMIQDVKPEPTPLQLKLAKLGKQLGFLTIIVSLIVFAVGIFKDQGPLLEIFLGAVALAVAAIPEGLPAVVTLSLGLGVRRMVKKNALIRKLPSVETLGSTTVICTDKTGTLTKNQMTVKSIYCNNKSYKITGDGYSVKGKITLKGKNVAVNKNKALKKLLEIGYFCNNATLGKKNTGDPTEIALLVSAKKGGIKGAGKRLKEIPFTSERKMMSTVNQVGKLKYIHTKGAAEMVLKKCTKVLINNTEKKITAKIRKEINKELKSMGGDALRVLGFAYKKIGKGRFNENSMVFVGMQGMIDPPRLEAKKAISKCYDSGIKVIMITGDHKDTAVAIARDLGITGSVMVGSDLNDIEDLDKIVEDIGIFARVNPEHKLKIVNALKKRGHIVAMTGDGVNDAPALKKADIGIAMGITGTDVAKEASEMVLLDDNFASIVGAIEEGRGIYNNIRKFVYYLLSSNIGEILTIFVGILIGLPLPLIAIQILFVNLATDGLPALAMGVDPIEKGIMANKPRDPHENILTKKMFSSMLVMGIIMMIGTLAVFASYLDTNINYARSMAFTTLVFFQLFNVFNAKSQHESFLHTWSNNKWLLGGVVSSIILQILVLYTPLNTVFRTLPLLPFDMFIAIVVASSVLFIGEGFKFWHDKHLH